MHVIDLDATDSDETPTATMASPRNKKRGSRDEPAAASKFAMRPTWQQLRRAEGPELERLADLLNRHLESTGQPSISAEQLTRQLNAIAARFPGQVSQRPQRRETASTKAPGTPRTRSKAKTAKPAKPAPRFARREPVRVPGVKPLSAAKMVIPSNSPSERRRVEMQSPQNDDGGHQMREAGRKIIEHENRHAAVLRMSGADPSATPQFTRAKGPDGRQHVVAGSVEANLTPIPGKPRATERKAEGIYRSAMADSDRSAEDLDVARNALFLAQESRQKKLELKHSKLASPYAVRRETYIPDHLRVPPTDENPSGNPYRIRMRNPLIAGAAMLGRAAGGALFRGAVATAGRSSAAGRFLRRTAVGARRFKRQATKYLGDRSGLDPLQSRAQVLSNTFQSLDRTAGSLNQNFGGLSQRLANFSPELAMQNAQNRVARINQNFQQSQTLGKPLAEFERQRGRIELAGRNIQADFAQAILPLVNVAVAMGADLAEILREVSRFASSIVQPITKAISENADIIAVAVGGLSAVAAKKLRDWARERAEADRIKNAGANLGQFFNMQIPPPNARPKLQGPNMAMPVFGAPPFKNAFGV